MNLYRHIVVKGRVQGVGFRFHTRKQATKLNLHGYVRNLANGDVEILAYGDSHALQQLLAWCRQGPQWADVAEVIVNEHASDEVLSGFEIR
jgi:acylphosphatase